MLNHALKEPAGHALSIIVLAVGLTGVCAGQPVSYFTYQGALTEAGQPATGRYDFRFDLFDSEELGTILVSTTSTLDVTDGVFTAQIEYGSAAVFAGGPVYLEISVGPEGDGPSTVLSPRQVIAPVPLALSATVAEEAILAGPDSVDSLSVIDGSLQAADLDTTQVQRRVSGSCPQGQSIRAIGGDGAVACETDDDTVVTAGAGLSQAGSVISIPEQGIAGIMLQDSSITSTKLADGSVTAAKIDIAQVQLRVTESCDPNSAIRSIKQDGTPVCLPAGETTDAFSGSAILSAGQQAQLNRWTGEPRRQWQRCYRRSKDGATAAAFHAQCDGRGPSITVLQMSSGQVFGGYSENSWSVVNAYLGYDRAFVFALAPNAERFPLGGTHYHLGTYHHPDYGPTFGGGHDFYVDSQMRLGYCNFPFAYACDGADGGPADNSCIQRLCGVPDQGSVNLHPVELEVWVHAD